MSSEWVLQPERSCKKIVNRIGFALLLHVILLYAPSLLGTFVLEPLWYEVLDPIAADVVTELYGGVTYMIAFMIPVLFFYKISFDLPTVPMPLQPKLPWETPLLVLGGMAVILSAAIANSWLLTPFRYDDFSNAVLWETSVTSNYQIVLLTITQALVPGVCEEFLFRGMIQTNLRPYGKTLSIFGSAVLFGLMHANAGQFLYATVAGVLLGYVRERTGSVWCGMFIHLFNNFFSVVETVLSERLPETTADAFCRSLEGVILAAGLLSVLFLGEKWLREKKKREKETLRVSGLFEKNIEADFVRPSNPIRKGSGFMVFVTPTMVVFFCYSIGSAILLLVESILFSLQ